MKNIALCTESDFDETVRSAIKQFVSFPEYAPMYLINEDTIEQTYDMWWREWERTYTCDCEAYRKDKDIIYSARCALEEMLGRIAGDEFILMVE